MGRRITGCVRSRRRAIALMFAGVTTLVSPLSASASTVVAGASAPVGGIVDYTGGTPSTGIPSLTSAGCFSGAATIRADVTADLTVTVNTAPTVAAYIGLASLLGSLNEGPCTNLVQEVAAVTGLTLTGTTSPTDGTLSCGPFSGFLDRIGPVLVLGATAPGCTVDGQATGPVGLELTTVWVPVPTTSPTLGVASSVPSASIAGALVLVGDS